MRPLQRRQFERRAALYSRLDIELFERTRFFAGAARINVVLARLFAALPAIRSLRRGHFLINVGAALEIDNVAYAREINRRLPGSSLDHALVCAEQGRLQYFVHAHQAGCLRQWESIRRELNRLLNNRYPATFFSRWCKDSKSVSQVLREVREHLGTDLDFASEFHRICIGLTLIDHIRRDTLRIVRRPACEVLMSA
jgi:hypothetical protein